MRESAEAKGRRYLVEGRLVVGRVSDGVIAATCRGSGVVHSVGYTAAVGWHCDCQAVGRCSHLVALQLVTSVPSGAS